MLDYGIIGNCLTCALVKRDASLDWLCYPNFTSPSVFAKILDDESGGSCAVSPVGDYTVTQRYVPDTAILETKFEGKRDAYALYDFFPRYARLLANGLKGLQELNILIRIIKPLRGTSAIRVHYDPRPDYALGDHAIREEHGMLMCGKGEFALASNIPPSSIFSRDHVILNATKFIALGERRLVSGVHVMRCQQWRTATQRYWEAWCATLRAPQDHRDTIVRSAITLKLLTYHPTGAIIAAPTTSLPEDYQGQRNWDYRYCWMRDAVMTADALKKIGRRFEAKRLIEFILARALEDDHIVPLYGIHGETALVEGELPHLRGYGGSAPVRVGNAAHLQNQHDIYGSLLDLLYLYFVYYRYERTIHRQEWLLVRRFVNYMRFHWYKRDSGIWEFRDHERHFTHSKLMCFVGVDRAVHIAQFAGQTQYVEAWSRLRHVIKEDILRRAWHEEAGAFTMHYGSDALDASVLLMAYHEFLEPTDIRMISTIHAIYDRLRDGVLVSRYRIDDGFGVSPAGFIPSSFWLIDALCYIGEVERAKELYTGICAHANHLGLFSEDIHRATKELMGNFPQSYSHIGLINSSIRLSEWSAKRRRIELIPGRQLH